METRPASSATVSELFNGGNYVVWSVQVKTYLIAQDLWDIVEGTDVLPEPGSEAALKVLTKKNAMALHVIQTSCKPRICLLISQITSAKLAWDALKAIKDLSKYIGDEYPDWEELTYVDWRDSIKECLEIVGLWDILEDEDASTEDDEDAGADGNEVARAGNNEVAGAEDNEVEDWHWIEKNVKALYLILESCGSKRFSLISNIGSAKDVWRALRDAHEEEMFGKYFASQYDPDFLHIREMNRSGYVNLEKDIRENKLEAVGQFLTSNPEAVSAKITNMGRTALHVAIVAGCDAIVRELLNRTTQEDLKIKDNAGLAVLDCCAVFGNKQMAEIIVTKFPALLSIGHGPKQILPVVLAIWRNSNAIDMVNYLYEQTPKDDLKRENGVNGATFINKCLYAKAFDLALKLLNYDPEFITRLDLDGVSPPVVLATLSYAFPSGNQLVFWKQWIYNGGPNLLRCISYRATVELPVNYAHQQGGSGESAPGFVSDILKLLGLNQIYESKSLHKQSRDFLQHMCRELPKVSAHRLEKGLVFEAICIAVKRGIVEFVSDILDTCPDFSTMCREKSTQRNIIMIAVLHRQKEVFNFIYSFNAKNSTTANHSKDNKGNSILHIAAMFEPSATSNSVPGAAFLMQSERQWFKVLKVLLVWAMVYVDQDLGHGLHLLGSSHKSLFSGNITHM